MSLAILLNRSARIFIDILVVLHCIGFIAVLWSGGYRLELFGLALKSHSLLPIVRGLFVLVLIRILLVSGLKNFLLVLVSITVTLLFSEIIIRIWDPPLAQPSLVQVHRASEVYDWELIPGAKGVGGAGEIIQINSSGFRDIDRPVRKPPGVKRVAVLGDSFTFGMSVNLQDTYVKKLEKLLQVEHPNVETLNFGVIGYHMWQYLTLLDTKVTEYEPDLIVIGLFLDDITLSVPPYTKTKQWKAHNPFEIIVPEKHKGSVFRLWNFIRNFNELLETKYRYKRGYKYLRGIEDRKQMIGPGSPAHEYYLAQIGELDEQQYREFRTAIRQLADITRHLNIPTIIMYIPDASQLKEPNRQHVNRFVKKTANNAGIPIIDVTPEFEQVADPRVLYLFPLDAHTSPEGHELMATVLAREIKKQKLLPDTVSE